MIELFNFYNKLYESMKNSLTGYLIHNNVIENYDPEKNYAIFKTGKIETEYILDGNIIYKIPLLTVISNNNDEIMNICSANQQLTDIIVNLECNGFVASNVILDTIEIDKDKNKKWFIKSNFSVHWTKND